jgi:LysM repeat protein
VDFPALMENYNVSYSALREANPGRDPLNVLPGQQYCVPPSGTTALCTGRKTYTVQQGDNLRTLPIKLGAPLYEIFAANPVRTPSMFTAGQIICRP